MKNSASVASTFSSIEPVLEISRFASPSIEVRVARSRAEVEEIREIWSAWPSHRDSDIDFCLDFFWTRAEIIRPHVIVIYRNGRPDALLVGRLERARMASRVGYLRLPGIPSRTLWFSQGGLLGNASGENCKEIVGSIMNALRRGEADLAVLDNLPVGSFIHDAALRVPGFANRDHLPKSATHHVMKLPSDIQQVYSALSGNHRSDLKRKAKRLLADNQGNTNVRCYQTPEELESVVQQVEEIAKKTYQRGLGVGFRDNEEMRKRLRFYAENGWLRTYILYLADTPCAFWIGTLYHGSFCSDYLAFDPRFAAYSPGTFLLMKVVEDFCAAGVKEIDFGAGEGRYKEQFGNSPTLEASAFVFAPSFKGVALNAVRTSSGLIDNLARKILERTALLPTIKRFWRLRLAKKAAADAN